MQKYLIAFFSLALLSSCGTNSAPVEAPVQKTAFTIKTEKLSDFSGTVSVEKTGRITASSNLTLMSKSAGEISKILIREGQTVKAGATIAILKDTVNNYDLRLDQAENAMAQQNASIATTEANMNNSVDTARIALERARLAYESATGRKNIASLTLSTADTKTLDSYNVIYRNYLSDLERQMTQMLYSGDKILGITSTFEHFNDGWEGNLGAGNGDSDITAANEWNKTYAARGDVRARIQKGTYITASTATEDLQYITEKYDQVIRYSDAMLDMIQHNIIGGSLSQMLQDSWIAEWNGIRSQAQASVSGYSSWKSQALGFLRTYEANEKATDLAIASLTRPLTPAELAILAGSNDMRVTYETTRLNLRDSVENARLGLEQATSSYNNALKIKDATLTQMRVMRDNASIALSQARRDYSKLSVPAPVDGTVTRMRVSVGDTINMGTPIADLAGKKPEIVMDVDNTLAKTLGVGDGVSVKVGKTTLSGSITAVSSVPGANLLSTVRMSVADAQKFIGQTATVIFPVVGAVSDHRVLLPIDSVRIVSEGQGEIALLNDKNEIIRKSVTIVTIGGTNVEVTGDFQAGDRVIISDITNYDPAKHNISPE